jgi:hypothetical protein
VDTSAKSLQQAFDLLRSSVQAALA